MTSNWRTVGPSNEGGAEPLFLVNMAIQSEEGNVGISPANDRNLIFQEMEIVT
jgi:hypothetical protein